MGQQQLLLIVLGVIIVGIAITMGILLFSENAVQQKRNEIISECSLLASQAQLHYRRTVEYGGGGRSFTGWAIPSQFKPTIAGSFSADVSAQEVIITGTGNDITTDGDSVQVQLTVHANEWTTAIIH